jgi:hypothetical protein
MCTREWHLQLASDEFLFPSVNWGIVLNDTRFDAYTFNRYHSVNSLSHFDKKVYPDLCLRLARAGTAGIQQTEIHESFQLTDMAARNSRIKQLQTHIIDIGDIRCEKQLAIKGRRRHQWCAGDLHNRKYFKQAGRTPAKTFILRKEDGVKTAALLPDAYVDFMHSVIPQGSAIWKELPWRPSV